MTAEPRLTVLGTGDAQASRYWNTCYLIEAGGQRLLIDCGYTIKHALANVDLVLADIDAVFITHVHGDHVHGLERLGLESRYVLNRRPQLLLAPGIRTPLWDRCLRGTMAGDGDHGELEDFFAVQDVDPAGFHWQDVNFRLFPTPHVPGKTSFGLIINDRLIITSDTNPVPWLAEDDSDRIILHDCSLDEVNPVHTTLNELEQVYPPQVLRRLWAIHYGDELETYRERIEGFCAGVAWQGQVFALGE